MLHFNIGQSNKRYSHDMGYHINTTSDFGSFQPICSQFMNPSDKYILKDFRQLVRNAVMPNPTFGDIKCVNNFRFVPMNEIFPQFDALIAGKEVNSYLLNYKPTSVPYVSNGYLVFMLSLLYSSMDILDVKVDNNASNSWGIPSDYSKPFTFTEISRINFSNYNDRKLYGEFKDIFKSFGLVINDDASAHLIDMFIGRNPSSFNQKAAQRLKLTPGNSDFVIFNKEQTKCLLVRLSARGKRLYKIFKGLGYALDAYNTNPVSILPLFAFYKAYFDKYAPTRDKGWQNTACFELINTIFEANLQNLQIVDQKENTAYHILVKKFFEELSECWYVFPDDYFSAHTTSPLQNVSANLSADIMNGDVSAETTVEPGKEHTPTLKPLTNNGSSFSLVQFQTLQRITRFLNKNSLIGNRIKEYVRSHYGSAVVSDLFQDSKDVATFITDVKLDDIYSSSDTVQQSGAVGEPLGKRGGRGDGFSSNNSFNFTAETFGYLIGFTAIYPNSFYCQGDDAQLYMRNRFDFPSADFDSLGYELTPLAQIVDNNGISFDSLDNASGKSFGFLPRYSMFKYKKGIINGDMSLRSRRDSFLSFHLERFIQRKEIVPFRLLPGSPVDDKKWNVIINDIPDAGTEWRYLAKYPQLGWFNRIFLNSGDTHNYDDLNFQADDNFTIQCVVDSIVVNQLKPLSQSFDTFQEDTDNNNISLSNV